MTLKAVTLSRYLVRAGAVLVVAMGASACSTVPDWVDPTTWVGGSDNDQASSDQGAQTADNGQTPDLSTIPEKPQAPSTADEQKNVAQSLAADRSQAQYSADALRGGTEPAAAPPPAEAAPSTEELASNENAAPAPEPAAPPAPPPPPAAGPGTLPANQAEQAATAPTPPPPAPPSEVASAAPPAVAAAPAESAQGAMPAVPAVGQQMAAQAPASDAALGFRPSSAPPLDPTVAQFVPASIMARYRQTAAIGPQPAVPAGTAYAVSAPSTTTKPAKHRRTAMGVGGPEAMSGAVVANFDALQGGVPAAAAAGSGGPAAVVFFPHDTTVLNDEAKEQVRLAAKQFLANGSQGYVRVIGHSSSRTGSMTAARHLVWNFERSQARANAVARALIQHGVPADKVLVQAVSDEEPVYQESMPQGEDGNRRAEIFFQS